MTVKIDRNAGSAPRPLVEVFVAGQSYPFLATLAHKSTKPLVVPSSGINTPIAPGEPVKVKVKSFDQAWMLVTDLAELAHRADNDVPDFAELVAAEVVDEAPAPVEAPTPADAKGSKAKAQEAK
ncbi:hypothetical protein [Pseudomonas sp. UMAB-40]|uniref:hypothetical protein n=1 Tax=Pseudomonas sp. UMAB-40 TaxID=1365407 RepID=UPI001C5663E1|nr:hypothetical protein [Pseudomonas sp. UMAB-40]